MPLNVNEVQTDTLDSKSGGNITANQKITGVDPTSAQDLATKSYVDTNAVDNTASNVGTQGEGVFFQKTGADLEFKNIDVTGGYLSVTTNGVNKTIEIQGGLIDNADVDASAGILSSKLDLTSISQQIGGSGFLDVSAGAGSSGRVPKLNSSGNIDSTMIPSDFLDETDGDARYFQQTEFVNITAGVANANDPVKLNASGLIDDTMINESGIDHTQISNIGTNTHAQIDSHIASTSNPHSVTAAQLSLGTSDDVTFQSVTQGDLNGNAGPIIADSTGKMVETHFQQAESLAEQTTTSTTFVNALTMNTESVQAGTYRIGISFNWAFDSGGADFEGRAQVDGSTTILQINQEPKDLGPDQFHPASGFAYVVLTASTHSITIDFASEDGSTAYIRDCRIEFWRIS